MNNSGKMKPLSIVFLLVAGLVALDYFDVIDIRSAVGGDKSLSIEAPADGGAPQISDVALEGSEFVSDSVLLRMYEEYSESPTASNGGDILLYTKGTSPSDPSAVALATLKVGTAYTTGDVACGREYRIAYNNASEAYAKDLGDQVLIDCNTEYNKQSADSLVDLTKKFGIKRTKVASLTDILDETDARNFNGGVNTTAAANTSINVPGLEIGCAVDAGAKCAADGVIVYDVSQGDGTWSIDLTFEAGGSQAALKDPVLTFAFEAGAEPEGNEVASMTMALRTGSDLGMSPATSWVNVWSNQENVKLKNPMTSGTSAVYRLTTTYTEANVASDDDWKVCFDDLSTKGNLLGRDARLNVGATQDCADFDAQA